MTAAIPRPAPRRALTIATWVLSVVLGLAFIAAGRAKLAGVPAMVASFETIGLGQWFRYVTGVIEVGAGIALVLPAWSIVGVALLVCTMIGAIIAHVAVLHESIVAPAALLVLLLVLGWLRRDLVPLRR